MFRKRSILWPKRTQMKKTKKTTLLIFYRQTNKKGKEKNVREKRTVSVTVVVTKVVVLSSAGVPTKPLFKITRFPRSQKRRKKKKKRTKKRKNGSPFLCFLSLTLFRSSLSHFTSLFLYVFLAGRTRSTRRKLGLLFL